jgi:hypothetical protein
VDNKKVSDNGIALWRKVRDYILKRILFGVIISIPLSTIACFGLLMYLILPLYWEQIVIYGKQALLYSGYAVAILFGLFLLGHLFLKFFNLDDSIDDAINGQQS